MDGTYDGTDENGIVGTVAPGLFAQEGRCWRMIYENPVGHGGNRLRVPGMFQLPVTDIHSFFRRIDLPLSVVVVAVR